MRQCDTEREGEIERASVRESEREREFAHANHYVTKKPVCVLSDGKKERWMDGWKWVNVTISPNLGAVKRFVFPKRAHTHTHKQNPKVFCFQSFLSLVFLSVIFAQ